MVRERTLLRYSCFCGWLSGRTENVSNHKQPFTFFAMYNSRFISFLFLIAMSGCASIESNPMVRMFNHVTDQGADERAKLDPQYHYLRVVVGERVIFMASDSPDINIMSNSGIWYSADREVLHFDNGRLVAAVGTASEWRGVALPDLPEWSEIASAKAPLKWVRTRDVMPGYRFGVRDDLVLKRIPPPGDSHLKSIDPGGLIWFEERLEAKSGAMSVDNLPPARYAVDMGGTQKKIVVYGEQCISAELCFSWQSWPVQQEPVQQEPGQQEPGK